MEFPDGKRYNTFVGYYRRRYGERLQKLVLDAGLTATEGSEGEAVHSVTMPPSIPATAFRESPLLNRSKKGSSSTGSAIRGRHITWHISNHIQILTLIWRHFADCIAPCLGTLPWWES